MGRAPLINSGGASGQHDFADAAKTLIDIERQIDGSTSPYFDLLNEVTELTKAALAGQENLISIATARDSPLMMRLRAGNMPGCGSIPIGVSVMRQPRPAAISFARSVCSGG